VSEDKPRFNSPGYGRVELREMTEAEKILKLISEVDPKDTEKLLEIEKSVAEYLGYERVEIARGLLGGPNSVMSWYDSDGILKTDRVSHVYTRSRDALKAIRPDGYYFFIIAHRWSYEKPTGYWYWNCHIEGGGLKDVVDYKSFNAPTEELAELHAIIQAIEYERTNKTL
jgi:hypothetical protein